MAMSWHDLLFLHWPLPPAVLAPFIPPPLTLDTFDGQAWLGVVPFHMSRIHLRNLPPIPGTAAFPEINVRTYAVAPDGRRGVWFFSLDATSWLAVRAARAWFGLPYFDAVIDVKAVDQGSDARAAATADAVATSANDGLPPRRGIDYTSTRTHRGAPAAAFNARYGPTGPVVRAAPGSLDHWLTERYALFAVDRRGRVGCGEIHHAPWPLQPAAVELRHNTMAEPLGVMLDPVANVASVADVADESPESHVSDGSDGSGGSAAAGAAGAIAVAATARATAPPLAHFARRLDVVAWPLRALPR
ncbi:MAG: DUF2071 domain-containing protein [Ardenticatenales bacterium]